MAALNRAHLSTIVFVILVVTSLGFVAATIDSAVVEDVGSDGTTNPQQEQPTGGDRIDVDVSGNETGDGGGQQINLVFCIPLLTEPAGILATIGGTALLIYLTGRRYNLATAGLFSAGLLPVVMFAYFFLTNCQGGNVGGGDSLLSGSEILSGSGGIQTPEIPPAVIGILFLGTVALTVVMFVTATGEEETFKPVEEEPDEPATADFARAAGQAADRIEEANVSVDNAVYRAWLQMTNALDIENPETTAPRDFAEAAVNAGLDRDDVTRLTELFTEVRYGGKSADRREAPALEVLRAIEDTYQGSSDQPGEDN